MLKRYCLYRIFLIVTNMDRISLMFATLLMVAMQESMAMLCYLCANEQCNKPIIGEETCQGECQSSRVRSNPNINWNITYGCVKSCKASRSSISHVQCCSSKLCNKVLPMKCNYCDDTSRYNKCKWEKNKIVIDSRKEYCLLGSTCVGERIYNEFPADNENPWLERHSCSVVNNICSRSSSTHEVKCCSSNNCTNDMTSFVKSEARFDYVTALIISALVAGLLIYWHTDSASNKERVDKDNNGQNKMFNKKNGALADELGIKLKSNYNPNAKRFLSEMVTRVFSRVVTPSKLFEPLPGFKDKASPSSSVNNITSKPADKKLPPAPKNLTIPAEMNTYGADSNMLSTSCPAPYGLAESINSGRNN